MDDFHEMMNHKKSFQTHTYIHTRHTHMEESQLVLQGRHEAGERLIVFLFHQLKSLPI